MNALVRFLLSACARIQDAVELPAAPFLEHFKTQKNTPMEYEPKAKKTGTRRLVLIEWETVVAINKYMEDR
jgi:hypothetical protein